ncbi:hypothetical protein [uncultured Nocardioides sp.]|uniref:hypothetical protein n=1 Tax=uncultured Nocardioides sp. TaxID=198441 RepID=UPI0026074537|nr:hypothetical protein [uncultured Nocardioides sp.]
MSPAAATVHETIVASDSPSPWKHALAPGENALLGLELSAGQKVFITTSTHSGTDYYHDPEDPDFGGVNTAVELLDSSGAIVAQAEEWSSVVELPYEAASSETYKIRFDPRGDASGHVELRAFDVTEPLESPLAGGVGRVVGTSPGQRLVATRIDTANTWASALSPREA